MALSDNKPTNFKIEDWREWTDENDFPTYQSDEATVRADLQYHPDFIKEKYNGMVEALEPYIEERISEVVVGVLPDGSVQTEMLADGSVSADKLNEDVTPEAINAADREHNHDDRYFTKEQFVDRQTRTDLMDEMEAELADGDMIPVYDASEDENLKLDWENLKAAMKAHIDETFAEDEATYHAARHRPDGPDPVHLATGNIDDQAVTHPKLSVIRPYNIYHQTVLVPGLEADPEMEHTTITSESDISDITFTVEDGKLKGDTLVLRDSLLVVSISVSHEGEDDIGYNVVFTVAGWTAESKEDEETAAVRFENIKKGAVSTDYEATIPAFEDDGSAWEWPEDQYGQTVEVAGLTADPDMEHTTVEPTPTYISYVVKDGALTAISSHGKRQNDLSVTITVAAEEEGEEDTTYEATFLGGTGEDSPWTKYGYTQTIGVDGLVAETEFTVEPEVEGVTFSIDENDKLTAVAESEPTEDFEITVTQDDNERHVTYKARKQKSTMDASGAPYILEPEGEDILETDEITLSVTPQPHDLSPDLCPYEEQCEIFQAADIAVRNVKDGKVFLKAKHRPTDTFWLRLSYPRSRSVASVSKDDWAREKDVDPWKQTVTVEGLPPWVEDIATHPDNHGVSKIEATTTSTGDALAVFNRLAKVEIASGGGAVDLTLDNGNKPGYAFQITFSTVDYYDYKVHPEDWNATGSPYTVEIDVEGLLETDKPIIDLLPDDDYAVADLEIESYSLIYRMVTEDGKLKVYAMEPIDVDLNIQIKAVRK